MVDLCYNVRIIVTIEAVVGLTCYKRKQKTN